MDWGLKNRLARIISPADNRALMLAVDHGYFLGPTEKLEDLKKTIAPLAKHCDSLMITRGALRTSVNPDYPVPVVLRVSGGTSIIGEDLSQEDITVSIKDALRLNVSAVAMSVFVGSKYEYQTIVNLGKLVNEAEEYGITSANADMMKTSDNPAIKRLVGAEGELGAAFGLDNDWSLRIIKQVGNYGESYKRNIADTGILPDRGPNELWTKGGILYVPPAR